MHSAIVRATKPLTTGASPKAVESSDACCGVDACCTPAETSVDSALTVTEAKTASGCACQN
jgi:arsenite methyltransferase